MAEITVRRQTLDIDLDGVSPDSVPYGFTATRYGTPTITATPTGTKVRPRSSTVVIQRADGGAIGV